jgi:hypothetical protein
MKPCTTNKCQKKKKRRRATTLQADVLPSPHSHKLIGHIYSNCLNKFLDNLELSKEESKEEQGTEAHACNPSTQEIKIGRITVQSQLRQKSSRDPISNNRDREW